MKTKYRQIFFDVDSTLVTVEGVDMLGEGNAEIARLTAAAMNGEIALEDVYAKRLEMINPTSARVDELAQRYIASMVEGAANTVRTLQDAGAVIHFVTAGIEQAVLPLAERLGVKSVHAVRLRFNADGTYNGFAPSALAKTGGKETIVRDIRARAHGQAAFIGDGVSDLEAKLAVDLFIGFGGVHIRPRVRDNADVFVTEMPAVIPHLIA